MHFRTWIFLFQLLLVASCAPQTITQPTIWAHKPDAAGLEKIVNDRLTAAKIAIAQVTGVKSTRTIANTVVPFDEAIRQINAAVYLSGLMEQIHPDASFRDRATQMFRKANAAQ